MPFSLGLSVMGQSSSFQVLCSMNIFLTSQAVLKDYFLLLWDAGTTNTVQAVIKRFGK